MIPLPAVYANEVAEVIPVVMKRVEVGMEREWKSRHSVLTRVTYLRSQGGVVTSTWWIGRVELGR